MAQQTDISKKETTQTAVDWLEKELYIRGPINEEMPIWIQDLFEQAKEIEKEQIIEAFWNGDNTDCTSEQNTKQFAEQYYNKTYEK